MELPQDPEAIAELIEKNLCGLAMVPPSRTQVGSYPLHAHRLDDEAFRIFREIYNLDRGLIEGDDIAVRIGLPCSPAVTESMKRYQRLLQDTLSNVLVSADQEQEPLLIKTIQQIVRLECDTGTDFEVAGDGCGNVRSGS